MKYIKDILGLSETDFKEIQAVLFNTYKDLTILKNKDKEMV